MGLQNETPRKALNVKLDIWKQEKAKGREVERQLEIVRIPYSNEMEKNLRN